MLQTDPFIVAAGQCGRGDRMCGGEAWAFVATQPTGPEPWPPTLHPGGQTKLWVTSETRHSVGRECLDRTQITPLTLQKRFMSFCFLPLERKLESWRVAPVCRKCRGVRRDSSCLLRVFVSHRDKLKCFIINDLEWSCDYHWYTHLPAVSLYTLKSPWYDQHEAHLEAVLRESLMHIHQPLWWICTMDYVNSPGISSV